MSSLEDLKKKVPVLADAPATVPKPRTLMDILNEAAPLPAATPTTPPVAPGSKVLELTAKQSPQPPKPAVLQPKERTLLDILNEAAPSGSHVPLREPKENITRFYKGISGIETQGHSNPYEAENPSSSAVGKYQFLWSEWGDDVAKFAKRPVSKEEFKKNPSLQENFAQHYYYNTLVPNAEKIKNRYPKSLAKRGIQDPDDIKSLLHFLGYGNTTNWLVSGVLPEKLQKDNVSVEKYLEKARKSRVQ